MFTVGGSRARLFPSRKALIFQIMILESQGLSLC